MKPGSQTSLFWALLCGGQERTVPEIHRAIGPCRLNSRAAELRRHVRQHGLGDIVCRRIPGETGAAAYAYQFTSSGACPQDDRPTSFPAGRLSPPVGRDAADVVGGTAAPEAPLVPVSAPAGASGQLSLTLWDAA